MYIRLLGLSQQAKICVLFLYCEQPKSNLPKMDSTYADRFHDLDLPIKVAATGLLATVTTFLAYIVFLSYTPHVDKNSPQFTSNTVPLVGSWGFFTQKW